VARDPTLTSSPGAPSAPGLRRSRRATLDIDTVTRS
jgi:hypothetical protein